MPEGTNVGLWGAFDIAARETVFTVRFETLENVTGRASETVNQAMQAYERIPGAALPRADSLDFASEMERPARPLALRSRDTTSRDGGTLTFQAEAWRSFAARIKQAQPASSP